MILILAKRKHHHHQNQNSSQLRMLNIGLVSCICLKCGLMLSVFEKRRRSYEVHPKQLLFMLFACKVKFLLSSILNISIAQMSEFDFAAWSGTLHNVAQRNAEKLKLLKCFTVRVLTYLTYIYRNILCQTLHAQGSLSSFLCVSKNSWYLVCFEQHNIESRTITSAIIAYVILTLFGLIWYACVALCIEIVCISYIKCYMIWTL